MQRAAEAQVATALEEIEARRAKRASREQERNRTPEQLEAALVALDPTTGRGARAWWGDAISKRVASIAPRRRCVNRARRSSRSCMRLRSRRATRRLPSYADSTSRSRRCKERGCPKTSTPTEPTMTVRTALRTSSNRAAVRMLEDVGLAKSRCAVAQDGYGQRSERAVARARFRRSHVDGDDHGVCSVRRSGADAARHIDPPHRRRGRQNTVRDEAGAGTGRLGANRVSHDEHACRRGELRYRIQGAPGGVHPSRSGEDGNDERLR